MKLDKGYRAMAADKEREEEAEAWCEGPISDVIFDHEFRRCPDQ